MDLWQVRFIPTEMENLHPEIDKNKVKKGYNITSHIVIHHQVQKNID